MNQVARDHIEFLRTRNGGILRPADVLADAKNPNSPLHPFFTWDDTEAANAFRLIQAKQVIRVAVRFLPTPTQEPKRVRIAAAPLVNRQPVARETKPQDALRRQILEAARKQVEANVVALMADQKAQAYAEHAKSLLASYTMNPHKMRDEALVVEWYARGIPISVLAEIAQDTSEDPDCDEPSGEWTTSRIEALVAEMAIVRPHGWTPDRAQSDWDADILEPAEDLFGVPPFMVPKPQASILNGADRAQGGSMRRFKLYTHGEPKHDKEAASLRIDHPALEEARTQFPTRVFDADEGNHILVSGHSNAKVGAFVTKGPWRGMDICTLTLEERRTCPTSCNLWNECYGNAMPFAKRREYGPRLMERLDEELREKAGTHPAGFVVRLHILGDFPDADYVRRWTAWMTEMPQIHIFGYTAHPADSQIGKLIAEANGQFSGRWAIRFSVAPETAPEAMQATTIWRKDRGRVEEGLVCPASSGDTDTCGTCGLCWLPGAADQRIVFLGHGMNRKGMAQRNPASVPDEAEVTRPTPQSAPSQIIVQPRVIDHEKPLSTIAGGASRDFASALEQVKWEDVLPWAKANKVPLIPGTKKGEILTTINEKRVLYGLPVWEVVEPDGRVVRGRVVV